MWEQIFIVLVSRSLHDFMMEAREAVEMMKAGEMSSVQIRESMVTVFFFPKQGHFSSGKLVVREQV